MQRYKCQARRQWHGQMLVDRWCVILLGFCNFSSIVQLIMNSSNRILGSWIWHARCNCVRSAVSFVWSTCERVDIAYVQYIQRRIDFTRPSVIWWPRKVVQSRSTNRCMFLNEASSRINQEKHDPVILSCTKGHRKRANNCKKPYSTYIWVTKHRMSL